MSVASASPMSSPLPDGLPLPRRYWAIAAIILAIVMSVLDSTIVNIALPSIAREFKVSAAASIWVVNAYQLAILMLLLPLASLGEIVGYRRVSQAGIVVFTLASLACALAPTLLTLSIARVLQGAGAAGIMSVNAALVRFTYRTAPSAVPSASTPSWWRAPRRSDRRLPRRCSRSRTGAGCSASMCRSAW